MFGAFGEESFWVPYQQPQRLSRILQRRGRRSDATEFNFLLRCCCGLDCPLFFLFDLLLPTSVKKTLVVVLLIIFILLSSLDLYAATFIVKMQKQQQQNSSASASGRLGNEFKICLLGVSVTFTVRFSKLEFVKF